MSFECIDTNVLIRYLVDTPETAAPRFRGVFSFFVALERGDSNVFLPDLVLFQTFFVLTGYYKVPSGMAAEKLQRILSFRGMHTTDRNILAACLGRLMKEPMDIVDAYLLEYSRAKRLTGIYSYDAELAKKGLTPRTI